MFQEAHSTTALFQEASGASSQQQAQQQQQHSELKHSDSLGSLAMQPQPQQQQDSSSKIPMLMGRRQKLPVPMSGAEGVNLWNLLCKNIGKDLSKIWMPVTLNEPLSALQRLCEELEYAELLDKAAAPDASQLDRMTWVAAFAVSIYGSCQVGFALFSFARGYFES